MRSSDKTLGSYNTAFSERKLDNLPQTALRDKGDSLIPGLVKNRSEPATKVHGFNQTRVTTSRQVDG